MCLKSETVCVRNISGQNKGFITHFFIIFKIEIHIFTMFSYQEINTVTKDLFDGRVNLSIILNKRKRNTINSVIVILYDYQIFLKKRRK